MKITNTYTVSDITVIEIYNEGENCFDYYVQYEDDANMYYSFGAEKQFGEEGIRNLINNGYFDGLSAPSLDDIENWQYEEIENYFLNNYDEDREEAPTKGDICRILMNNPYEIIYGLICMIDELNKAIDEL